MFILRFRTILLNCWFVPEPVHKRHVWKTPLFWWLKRLSLLLVISHWNKLMNPSRYCDIQFIGVHSLDFGRLWNATWSWDHCYYASKVFCAVFDLLIGLCVYTRNPASPHGITVLCREPCGWQHGRTSRLLSLDVAFSVNFLDMIDKFMNIICTILMCIQNWFSNITVALLDQLLLWGLSALAMLDVQDSKTLCISLAGQKLGHLSNILLR